MTLTKRGARSTDGRSHKQSTLINQPSAPPRRGQAGLTLVGNATVALAALRIALAAGWAPSLPNPFQARPFRAAPPARARASRSHRRTRP